MYIVNVPRYACEIFVNNDGLWKVFDYENFRIYGIIFKISINIIMSLLSYAITYVHARDEDLDASNGPEHYIIILLTPAGVWDLL